MMIPELERMAEDYHGDVFITKIDCTVLPQNKKWAMGESSSNAHLGVVPQ